MDFADALRHVRAGGKAAREGMPWAVDLAVVGEAGGEPFPLLMCFYEDGLRIPFAGACWDLLADDWVLL